MTEHDLQNKTMSSPSEEFLDRISPFAEKCPHLQIFLHRGKMHKDFTDYEFLMVTPDSFGKVEVLDIYVDEPDIVIKYIDCRSDQVGQVRINVYDTHPKTLFINWQDLKNIVIADINNHLFEDDILEFDYS